MMLLLLENKLHLAPIVEKPQVVQPSLNCLHITDCLLENLRHWDWDWDMGNVCPILQP